MYAYDDTVAPRCSLQLKSWSPKNQLRLRPWRAERSGNISEIGKSLQGFRNSLYAVSTLLI